MIFLSLYALRSSICLPFKAFDILFIVEMISLSLLFIFLIKSSVFLILVNSSVDEDIYELKSSTVLSSRSFLSTKKKTLSISGRLLISNANLNDVNVLPDPVEWKQYPFFSSFKHLSFSASNA